MCPKFRSNSTVVEMSAFITLKVVVSGKTLSFSVACDAIMTSKNNWSAKMTNDNFAEHMTNGPFVIIDGDKNTGKL